MEECNIGLKQEEWYWKTCKEPILETWLYTSLILGFGSKVVGIVSFEQEGLGFLCLSNTMCSIHYSQQRSAKTFKKCSVTQAGFIIIHIF